ncbi:MAG: flagellar hook-basal body complex protein FliE [Candidatus Competibacteraceae bacterium]|nr:flagellar hook-basal body complex protein FliE [Candidatus Competibacteraceae bacterium]MCP5125037.1 flagellar hook-basal body complex protein FliE [Gammaproteobacteria bacterium]
MIDTSRGQEPMSNVDTTSALTQGLRNLTPGTDQSLSSAHVDIQHLESEDFASVFKSMLVGVNQSQQHSRQLTESFDIGQHDDLAGVMIAQQKAKLAFQSTLQVRNKLVTAYQDIMNMPV